MDKFHSALPRVIALPWLSAIISQIALESMITYTNSLTQHKEFYTMLSKCLVCPASEAYFTGRTTLSFIYQLSKFKDMLTFLLTTPLNLSHTCLQLYVHALKHMY